MPSTTHILLALGLSASLILYVGYSYYSIGYETTARFFQSAQGTFRKGQDEPAIAETPANDMVRNFYVSGFSQPHPELCPLNGSDLKLFIFITSAPDHAESRQAIRQTWGHYKMRTDVEIAFMLGATSNTKLKKDITKEDDTYGDIVLGQNIDSYNNLTLKTLSMLEWIDQYCPQADFFLKTDDDVFLNVVNLLKFIDSKAKARRTMFGRLTEKWDPVRSIKSPYYLSRKDFPADIFPNFMTGPAYLMTQDCVRGLYHAAFDQKYLKLEDVFITGILVNKMTIKQEKVDSFYNMRVVDDICKLKNGISIHMVQVKEQFRLWGEMFNSEKKC